MHDTVTSWLLYHHGSVHPFTNPSSRDMAWLLIIEQMKRCILMSLLDSLPNMDQNGDKFWEWKTHGEIALEALLIVYRPTHQGRFLARHEPKHM
jgi:hypothetical protein